MENLVNNQLLFEKFSNKKVFITGHTGFKGTWLSALLYKLNAKVKGYALSPKTNQNLFDIVNENERICESIIHDIRDIGKLREELLVFKPDYIFHLAAQPLVRYSYKEPVETFEVNAMGTTYLLDAIRFLEGKCTIIIITTDKVYHNNESEKAYHEEDQLGGYDPYSSSKAMAELVTNSYRNSYFNPDHFDTHQKSVATARAGNVIGGGDWSDDRIIPDIIKALSSDEPIVVRNPNSVRPWQHVLEPLCGYLLLAAKLAEDPKGISGAWNFGPWPEDQLTVLELVNMAISSWGSGSIQVNREAAAAHEAGLLKLNISKAVKSLSWKPILNAETAINWTLDWYKQGVVNRKKYTFHQIEEYLTK